MILLFSRADISTKIAIDPKDVEDYLRLRFVVDAHLDVAKEKNYSLGAIISTMLDRHFFDEQIHKDCVERFFDEWSTRIRLLKQTAHVYPYNDDIIMVEVI